MGARRIASSSSLRFLSVSSTSIQNPTYYTYEILNSNMSCIANHRTSNVYNHSQRQHIMSFSTKTRRRRRGGGAISETFQHRSPDEDDNTYSSTTSTKPSLSEEQFKITANGLLDKVESAMIKLVDCNDGLEITRYPPSSSDESSTRDYSGDEEEEDDDSEEEHLGKLSIQIESSGDMFWGGGTYWLTILPESRGLVKLQSPLSGSFSYTYNTTTQDWESSEDGHSLLGMFTRDWIRQAKGVPGF